MSLFDKILKDVNPDSIEQYQSHIYLHLKEILTIISKNKLE
jgi:hypothetical protein